MKQIVLVLLLAMAPMLSTAQPEDDIDKLLLSLAPIHHLQGNFTQRQYTLDNQLVAESSGRFSLLRPGYFSWEIIHPDEQLIIADPEFVWHYDRDLETVTRRPVSESTQSTPLQILGGDETALRKHFKVVQSAKGTFLLTPLSVEAGFKQLTLSLNQSRLTGMNITDNLDQTVVIEFSDLDSDGNLSSTDFAFSPPVGADLFYYDE
jgi:outer membrane lipoprotein carrier protein